MSCTQDCRHSPRDILLDVHSGTEVCTNCALVVTPQIYGAQARGWAGCVLPPPGERSPPPLPPLMAPLPPHPLPPEPLPTPLPAERDRVEAQDFIERIKIANWLPSEDIIKCALRLYETYTHMRVFSRRKRHEFIACALYAACSQESAPITLHELQEATDLHMGAIVRVQRSIADVCIDADSQWAQPRSLLIRYGYYMGFQRREVNLLLDGLNVLYGYGSHPGRILAAALVVYFKRCTKRRGLHLKYVCTTLRVSYPPVRVLASKIEREFGHILSAIFLHSCRRRCSRRSPP
jgi:hypothetical protein